MGLSIQDQLKKYHNLSPFRKMDSWLRRDILVVTQKTEEIIQLIGDKVIVVNENEYVPPVMRIGKVFAGCSVRLTNTAWWDDLRLRSVDKAINLL